MFNPDNYTHTELVKLASIGEEALLNSIESKNAKKIATVKKLAKTLKKSSAESSTEGNSTLKNVGIGLGVGGGLGLVKKLIEHAKTKDDENADNSLKSYLKNIVGGALLTGGAAAAYNPVKSKLKDWYKSQKIIAEKAADREKNPVFKFEETIKFPRKQTEPSFKDFITGNVSKEIEKPILVQDYEKLPKAEKAKWDIHNPQVVKEKVVDNDYEKPSKLYNILKSVKALAAKK